VRYQQKKRLLASVAQSRALMWRQRNSLGVGSCLALSDFAVLGAWTCSTELWLEQSVLQVCFFFPLSEHNVSKPSPEASNRAAALPLLCLPDSIIQCRMG